MVKERAEPLPLPYRDILAEYHKIPGIERYIEIWRSTELTETYRKERDMLRNNIDALRKYALNREANYDNDGDCMVDAYRRGMAAAYGDMARKLAVAAGGTIKTGVSANER